MDVFLVGGYVRDTLLGLDPKDRDYVVIGESPDSMRQQGFELVGNHFPVFLHPDTHEEYALARSEKSTGKGHSEFECAWEGVTLEDDLKRRDFTINAMALSSEGTLIDPYNGVRDLEQGKLRNVSEHFVEDPLRILRAARFAARYGFTVDAELNALMTQMVRNDMLETLPADRLWAETYKAMLERDPLAFFQVLDDCGALERVFPELAMLKGVPQRPDYHSEGDSFIHSMWVVKEAALYSANLDDSRRIRILMAALLHDLGKSQTPKELLWDGDGNPIGRHHGHEDPERFAHLLDSLAERLRMPHSIRDFVFKMTVVHQAVHAIHKSKAPGLVRMYERLDASRVLRHDPHYLADLAMACEADNYGRLVLQPDGSTKRPDHYAQRDYFIEAMTTIHSVSPGKIIQEQLQLGRTLDVAKEKVVAAQRASVVPMIKAQRSMSVDERHELLGTRA